MTQTPAADIVEKLFLRICNLDASTRQNGPSHSGTLLAAELREAATEIEALRAREAELTSFDLIPEGEHAKALTRIDTLQRKLDEAVKALEPFAEWAEWFTECEEHRNGCPDNASAGESMEITVGDIRMAKSALASIRGEG